MTEYPFLKGWFDRIAGRSATIDLEQAPEPIDPPVSSSWIVEHSIATVRLPAAPPPFDGYPYLVSRIGHTPLRHHALLPADWTRSRLRHLTRRQAEANRLQTCLVTGPKEAAYFGETGRVLDSERLPTGHPIHGRLALAEPIPESEELAARRQALQAYCELHRLEGYLVGDGLEAGRYATPADMDRYLIGPLDGMPKGLARCPACSHLAGEYIAFRGEGNGDTVPRVVQVHCPCENHNRCAACGQPLASRRLSSYGYDEGKRSVIYFAAYMGLGHRCG
jgi:hypothetical protein